MILVFGTSFPVIRGVFRLSETYFGPEKKPKFGVFWAQTEPKENALKQPFFGQKRPNKVS